MRLAKRALAAITRGVYLVAYPVIGLLLHDSHRVRVVVVCHDHILLQRSYWGAQTWGLPGGGVARRETPEAAAARETREETGVNLATTQLQTIGARRLPADKRWPQTNITFLYATLAKRQPPRLTHHLEIIEARWFALDKLPPNRSETVDISLQLLTEAETTGA